MVSKLKTHPYRKKRDAEGKISKIDRTDLYTVVFGFCRLKSEVQIEKLSATLMISFSHYKLFAIMKNKFVAFEVYKTCSEN